MTTKLLVDITAGFVVCADQAALQRLSALNIITLLLVPVIALNIHLIIPTLVDGEHSQWRFRLLTHVAAVALMLLVLRNWLSS